jgi:hypothetical protein
MCIAALNPTPPPTPEKMMNEYAAKEVFRQAENFLTTARVPEQFQAAMQDGVGKSREFYSKAAAVTQDGAKVLTEVADTAWSSTKMLNAKIIENTTANAEATFDAAQAIARATSFSEVAKIQSEFVLALTAKAAAQSKEFFDLSARATQHVIETAQAAASKSLKAGF